MLRLFTRRSLIVPTLLGWVVLVAVSGSALWLLRLPLHDWLAPVKPAPAAAVQVIEGWMGWAELKHVVHLLGPGPRALLVTSGGPLDGMPGAATHAQRAADMLKAQGLGGVVPLPCEDTRIDRTYFSALAVREGLRARGLQPKAITVFSPGAHARRSRLVYQMVFGDGVEVGIVAVEPDDYDPARWWTSSQGAKFVLGELLSWTWTQCCFWPDVPQH